MFRASLSFFMAGALLCCAGCNRGNPLAEIEARERSSTLFRQARAAEQAGNLNEAIDLLNRVLREEPKDYSAHFQLATLLHDHAEDYIGAIYHYNQYLTLRPESDKSNLAKDRLRVAEQLLAPQILKKVGDSVEGISQVHLLKEVEKLNRQIATLIGEKSALQDEKAKEDAEMKTLTADNERLRTIVDKMRQEPVVTAEARKPLPKKEASTTAPIRKPAAVARKEEVAHPDTSLTSDELKRLRAEAEALSTATGGKKTVATVEGPSESAAKSVPAADGSITKEEKSAFTSFLNRNKKARPTKSSGEMRTYVVQPGDTLLRVSEKFYGVSTQWKRIRDANRANIDPDGRIRAGQIILVP